MPEGKGSRIVRALNSLGRKGAGIIFSDSTSQGPELVLIEINSQTNEVTLDAVPGRYGENFVEVGEDDSILGAEETGHFNRPAEVTQDVDTGQLVETNAGVNPVFTPAESDEERRKREKRERKQG